MQAEEVETAYQGHSHTPSSPVAWFTTSRAQKHLKFPPVGEQIDWMCYTYTQQTTTQPSQRRKSCHLWHHGWIKWALYLVRRAQHRKILHDLTHTWSVKKVKLMETGIKMVTPRLGMESLEICQFKDTQFIQSFRRNKIYKSYCTAWRLHHTVLCIWKLLREPRLQALSPQGVGWHCDAPGQAVACNTGRFIPDSALLIHLEQRWHTAQVLGPCHPCGRCGWGLWLLASAWSNLNCCGRLERKICLSGLLLCHSAFK